MYFYERCVNIQFFKINIKSKVVFCNEAWKCKICIVLYRVLVTVLHVSPEYEFLVNLLFQAYVKSDSKKRSILELALQANVELHKQRAETEAGIRRMHGLTQNLTSDGDT
jgi:hypothetical protein